MADFVRDHSPTTKAAQSYACYSDLNYPYSRGTARLGLLESVNKCQVHGFGAGGLELYYLILLYSLLIFLQGATLGRDIDWSGTGIWDSNTYVTDGSGGRPAALDFYDSVFYFLFSKMFYS